MDDSLEIPTAIQKQLPTQERHEGNEEDSTDDEDEGPDWTKLPTVLRPVIPKRGEKDFEPSTHGGSGLQRHVLDRSRSAMLEALKATRTASIKSMSYAVWYPSLARARVTTARGTHFANMGHSVVRGGTEPSSQEKIGKHLELLPEEALYLVERGTMFCWKATNIAVPEGMDGEPMTVQQAFCEMIGREDLTLEKYQVFAYLKRLGYVVTRTTPPSPAYPSAAPFSSLVPHDDSSTSLFSRHLGRLFDSIAHFLRNLVARAPAFDWWAPVRLHHSMTYPSLFSALRFLPYGYKAELHLKEPVNPSPYDIFFNVYKPSTPFRKTAPPAPDYSVVVVNARTTSMPSLQELDSLFSGLPFLPPPAPRRRTAFGSSGKSNASQAKPGTFNTPTGSIPENNWSLWRSVLAKVYVIFPCIPVKGAPANSKGSTATAVRRPNPFAILKSGKKMIVVAAVDAGTISFFRFGHGAFEDFPMN